MKRAIFCMATMGLLLGAAGCAHNSIVGDGAVRTDQFFGDVGIASDDTDVTILRGSKVPKLSLLGSDNKVTVQDGVWISKIEFWGKRNVVSLPEGMTYSTTHVGTDNQILRRPRERRPIEGVSPSPEHDTGVGETEDTLIEPDVEDWSESDEAEEFGA